MSLVTDRNPDDCQLDITSSLHGSFACSSESAGSGDDMRASAILLSAFKYNQLNERSPVSPVSPDSISSNSFLPDTLNQGNDFSGSPTPTLVDATFDSTSGSNEKSLGSKKFAKKTKFPSIIKSLRRRDPAVPIVCANCSTSETSLWRRDIHGQLVCNACRLYYKLNGVDRPVSLKRPIVKRRRRKAGQDLVVVDTAVCQTSALEMLNQIAAAQMKVEFISSKPSCSAFTLSAAAAAHNTLQYPSPVSSPCPSPSPLGSTFSSSSSCRSFPLKVRLPSIGKVLSSPRVAARHSQQAKLPPIRTNQVRDWIMNRN